MKTHLEKIGALSAFEYQLLIAAQVLVALAVVGHLLSYRRHRKPWLLGLALASAAAVFAGLYLVGSELLVYAGLGGLVATSATDFSRRFSLQRRPDELKENAWNRK